MAFFNVVSQNNNHDNNATSNISNNGSKKTCRNYNDKRSNSTNNRRPFVILGIYRAGSILEVAAKDSVQSFEFLCISLHQHVFWCFFLC